MAEKDSQDGTESDAEGRVATGPPRTEGGPAGTGAAQTGGAGQILSIAPTEIASDEAPLGEAIDTPFDSMVGRSQDIDHAPQDDIQAPVEAEATADRPSEIDEPAYAHFEPQLPPVPIETPQISTEPPTLSAAKSVSTHERMASGRATGHSNSSGLYGPTVPTSDYERRRSEALRLLTKGARYAAYGAAGYLALVVFLIFAYRLVNPPGSTLMLLRLLGGTSIERTWVPIERISPNLIRAVVVSEDGRFCDHWGIDFDAIREVIRRSGDGTPRGASTISMQVTKNLFLWPSKSYIRKVVEVPLTFLIELIWPKRRILEIYLNVAEWGPGIFGAEAAAQHHFRRPASRLGEREAALLAASLPNPVRRDAGDPGPRTSRKARVIQARMHVSGPVAACVTGRQ